MGRADIANAFIRVIANCGRKFFAHSGEVSRLVVDSRGRVWFFDAYSKRDIYVAYRYHWRGFTEGGTLRCLIERLRDFVRTGERPRLALGPWPPEFCNGDLWGYGADMQLVRDAAERSFGKVDAA